MQMMIDDGCMALQETEAGDALLDAINESQPRPLQDQVTLFLPTSAALSEAAEAFGVDPDISVDRLVDVRSPAAPLRDISQVALPRGTALMPCSNTLLQPFTAHNPRAAVGDPLMSTPLFMRQVMYAPLVHCAMHCRS